MPLDHELYKVAGDISQLPKLNPDAIYAALLDHKVKVVEEQDHLSNGLERGSESHGDQDIVGSQAISLRRIADSFEALVKVGEWLKELAIKERDSHL